MKKLGRDMTRLENIKQHLGSEDRDMVADYFTDVPWLVEKLETCEKLLQGCNLNRSGPKPTLTKIRELLEELKEG